MVLNDIARFDEFAQSCGNRYAAVRVIAKWARDIGVQFKEYSISESKLIEIVLNGSYYSDSELSSRRHRTEIDNLNDFLEWTLDSKVVDEVKHCYTQSIANKKLVTCRNELLSRGQAAKVNILLKLIWYSTER